MIFYTLYSKHCFSSQKTQYPLKCLNIWNNFIYGGRKMKMAKHIFVFNFEMKKI